MKKRITEKQTNCKNCFVCGRENPSSMNADFYNLEDGTIAAVATARSIHQSYSNIVHGGVSAALLDETIGRAIQPQHPDAWGITLEINVSYREPVPYDVPLIITGRVVEQNGRKFRGEGEIILPNGHIAAVGTGLYLIMEQKHMEKMGYTEDMMIYYPSDKELEEIEIPEPPIV